MTFKEWWDKGNRCAPLPTQEWIKSGWDAAKSDSQAELRLREQEIEELKKCNVELEDALKRTAEYANPNKQQASAYRDDLIKTFKYYLHEGE